MIESLDKIRAVINSYNLEAASNTPDWILAEFVGDCIDALSAAIVQRDKWYGIAPYPGKSASEEKNKSAVALFRDLINNCDDGKEMYAWAQDHIEQIYAVCAQSPPLPNNSFQLTEGHLPQCCFTKGSQFPDICEYRRDGKCSRNLGC